MPDGENTPNYLEEAKKWSVPELQSMADQIAENYGIDKGMFRALIGHESEGWKVDAANPKSSALGLGQFLDETNREYNLGLKTIDRGIGGAPNPADERLHPGKMMDAAARLLLAKKGDTWAERIKNYGEGTDEYLNRVVRQWQKDQAKPTEGYLEAAKAGLHEGAAKTAATIASIPSRGAAYLMEKAGGLGFPETSPEELARVQDIAKSTEGGVERFISPTPYGPTQGFMPQLVRGLASGAPELAGLLLSGMAVPQLAVPQTLAKISPLAARLFPAMAHTAGTFGLWDILKGEGPQQAAIGAGMGAALPIVGPTYGRLARAGYGGAVGGAATLAQSLMEGRTPTVEELGQGIATMGIYHALPGKRLSPEDMAKKQQEDFWKNVKLDTSQFEVTPQNKPVPVAQLPAPQLALPAPKTIYGPETAREPDFVIPPQRPETVRRPLWESMVSTPVAPSYPPVLETIPGVSPKRALGLRPQDVVERLMLQAAGLPESAGLRSGPGLRAQIPVKMARQLEIMPPEAPPVPQAAPPSEPATIPQVSPERGIEVGKEGVKEGWQDTYQPKIDRQQEIMKEIIAKQRRAKSPKTKDALNAERTKINDEIQRLIQAREIDPNTPEWEKGEYRQLDPSARQFGWWRDQLKKETIPLEPEKLTEDQFVNGINFLDRAREIIEKAREEVPNLKYNDIQFKGWPEWAKKEMIALEKEQIQVEDARGKAYQNLIEILKEKYPEKAGALDLGFARPEINKETYKLFRESILTKHPTPAPAKGREPWEPNFVERTYDYVDKIGKHPWEMSYEEFSKFQGTLPEYEVLGIAHADRRWYIQTAIEKGHKIPPAVLADYPDLAEKYEKDIEYSPPVLQGMKDWLENKAYPDGNGNWRYKETRKITPWNKEVKSVFKNFSELHDAAEKTFPEIVAYDKERTKGEYGWAAKGKPFDTPELATVESEKGTVTGEKYAIKEQESITSPESMFEAQGRNNINAQMGEGQRGEMGITEPGISEKPPRPPISKEIIQDTFGPKSQVFEGKDSYTVLLPNQHTIRINTNAEIEVSKDVLKKDYNIETLADQQYVAGEWRPLDRGGMISLAKGEGKETLNHETLHGAADLVLTEKEKAAVLKEYGDWEKAARAYEIWNPGEKPHGIFQKVLDFVRNIYRKFFPDAETVFGRVKNAEVWERKAPKELRYAFDNAKTTEEIGRYSLRKIVTPDDVVNFKREINNFVDKTKDYTTWLRGKLATPNASLWERLKSLTPDVTNEDMNFVGKLMRLPSWRAKEDTDVKRIWNISRNLRLEVPSVLRVRALEDLRPVLELGTKDLERLKYWWVDQADKINQSGMSLEKQQEAFDKLTERIKTTEKPQVYEAFMAAQRFFADSKRITLDRLAAQGIPETELKKLRQQIGGLIGYFPHLWDEGKYYVVALDKEGNTIERATAGSLALRRIIDQMQTKYPKLDIKSGKNQGLPEELFFGLNPAHAEIMARQAVEKAGLDKRVADKVIREMADTFKARGFGSRFIERENVLGYITNAHRIPELLTKYVMGWSGFIGKLEAAPRYLEALADIDPKTKPTVYGWAENYIRDVLQNSGRIDQSLGKLRNLMYIKNIIGVPSTAMLNLTQNATAFAPYISAIKNPVTGKMTQNAYLKTNTAMMDLVKDGRAYWQFINGKKTPEWRRLTEEESRAMTDAFATGHMYDSLTKDLIGSQFGPAGKILNLFSDAMGFMFGNAEKFNRASSFLMAFREFRNEHKLPYQEAVDKAKTAVDDTQFVYGKYNLPELARTGAIGKGIRSTGYVFKQFVHNYYELMRHLAKQEGGLKAIGKAAGTMAFLGGATAIPLVRELSALYKSITGQDPLQAAWTGANKEEDKFYTLFRFGIPGFLGVDFSGPIAVELPGVSYQTPAGLAVDVLGGPLGRTVATEIPQAIDYYRRGAPARAIESVAPRFLKGPMKAYREGTEGVTTKRGQAVTDEFGRPLQLTQTEALIRSLGFQPPTATIHRESQEQLYEAMQQRQDRQDILASRYLNAIRNQDSQEMQRVMADTAQYNMEAARRGEPGIDLQSLLQRRMKPKTVPKSWQGYQMRNR